MGSVDSQWAQRVPGWNNGRHRPRDTDKVECFPLSRPTRRPVASLVQVTPSQPSRAKPWASPGPPELSFSFPMPLSPVPGGTFFCSLHPARRSQVARTQSWENHKMTARFSGTLPAGIPCRDWREPCGRSLDPFRNAGLGVVGNALCEKPDSPATQRPKRPSEPSTPDTPGTLCSGGVALAAFVSGTPVPVATGEAELPETIQKKKRAGFLRTCVSGTHGGMTGEERETR